MTIQLVPGMANPASSTPPPPVIPHDAEAPFNLKASTDVTLRSAGKVDFHVNQLVLMLSSSFFKKQLDAMQPVTGSDTSISSHIVTDRLVIDVPEDAHVIDIMLRCCYPITKPSLGKLEDVRTVLDAAQKYGMVVVARFAEDALLRFCHQYPLDVLGISIRCDLYTTFLKVVSEILELPSFLLLESKELDGMSGVQYHILVKLYNLCAPQPAFRYVDSMHDIFKKLVASRFERCELVPLVFRPYAERASFPSIFSNASKDYTNCACQYRALSCSPRTSSSEADAPFDDRDADVILRSCDKINFHVYKNILSIASPIFKERCNIPRPWIFEIAEDAQTLDLLLRCIYPVPMPNLERDDIFFVLEAARKYDIKDVVGVAEAALLAYIDRYPFSIFILAIHCRIEHLCGTAARRLLEIQPTKEGPMLLLHISARTYRKLLQYHQRCGEAASAVARSRGWFSDYLGVVSQHRPCDCFVADEQDSGWFAHQEVWDYLEKAEETLLHIPHSASVLSPSEPIDVSCEKCGRRSYGRELCHALEFAVKEATSEEKIEIPKFC